MKFKIIAISMFLLLWATLSWAQFTGQLRPAGTISKNSAEGLAGIGIYDGAFGLFGEYRYGVGGYTDIAGKIGFIDFDDSNISGMILGGDVKYQVMEMRLKDPLDLSVGGQFEAVVFTPANFFSLGPFVSGSYPIKLNSGKSISPYGKLIFRMKWYDAGRRTESNFDLGFNAGASLELKNSTSVSAEFQFHDPFGFLMGISFGL